MPTVLVCGALLGGHFYYYYYYSSCAVIGGGAPRMLLASSFLGFSAASEDLIAPNETTRVAVPCMMWLHGCRTDAPATSYESPCAELLARQRA